MSSFLSILAELSGWTVAAFLNSLWQGLVLILLTSLALKVAPQFVAATRYSLWWLVLIGLLAMPLAESVIGVQPDLASTKAVWPIAVFTVWLFVVMLRVVDIVRGYRRLRGIRRRAHRVSREQRLDFDAWVLSCKIGRPVRLLVSNEITSPVTVGFGEPAVIVPEALMAQFTQSELDHVLLHELAHLARRDDWTMLIAQLSTAVLNLHPLAPWILGWMEHERRIACDDWAVTATGDARSYAASLDHLFEFSRAQQIRP